MLKYIFNCCLIAIFALSGRYHLYAQSNDSLVVKKGSILVKEDSISKVKKPLRFQNLYAGPDIIGPLTGLFYKNHKDYSFMAEVWSNKSWGVGISGGYQNFSYTSQLTDVYRYKSYGGYIKAVAMKNFLSKISTSHKAYFGFGIASGLFTHQMDYKRNRGGWGTYERHIEEKNNAAFWAELNTGFRVKILPKIGLGYELVLKKKLLVGGKPDFSIASIPGYGKNGNTNFAARYYIFIGIGK